jgi:hypothetical protein
MKYFPPDGDLQGCITSLVMMFFWALMFFYYVGNYLLVILVFVAKYFYIVRFVMAKVGLDKCLEKQREKALAGEKTSEVSEVTVDMNQ